MKNQISVTVVNKFRKHNPELDLIDINKIINENSDSDMIVFPEECLTGFSDIEEYSQILDKLQVISNKHDIVVVTGIEELSEDSGSSKIKRYNSAFIFDKDKIYKYRKNHLVWAEPDIREFGNLGFPVYDTSVGKIGMIICFDLELPESIRCLKLNDAEIVCVCAAWPDFHADFWNIYLKTRARENQVFILASNDCGFEESADKTIRIDFCGNSSIISPFGELIAGTGKEEKRAVSGYIDLNMVKDIRESLSKTNSNPLRARRPELYEIICR